MKNVVGEKVGERENEKERERKYSVTVESVWVLCCSNTANMILYVFGSLHRIWGVVVSTMVQLLRAVQLRFCHEI